MSNEEDRTLRLNKLEAENAELRAELAKKEKHIQAMRWNEEAARDRATKLQREVDRARIQAEKRNRELDALRYVWCDGGCNGGMSRYEGDSDEITEELVLLAERNTARMRSWLENRRSKQSQPSPQACQMLQGLLDALPCCTVYDCGKIATKVQRGEHGVEGYACDEHVVGLDPNRTADLPWADVIRQEGK